MNAKPHSPEWLIANADHGVAFERACASALERLLTENANLQQQLEAIGAGGVGPLMKISHPGQCPDMVTLPLEVVEQVLNAFDCIHSPLLIREIIKIGAAKAKLPATLEQPPTTEQSSAVEQPRGGQEPDWQDLYQKEKRRAEMWTAKYEQDIGKLERAVPVVALRPKGEHRPGPQLTDNERTELLDWVSACQSAYSMENNPRGPFFALPGQLQENRDSLVDYVNEILEARCQQPQREPLTPSEVDQLEARWDACLHGSKIAFAARETERAHGIGSKP